VTRRAFPEILPLDIGEFRFAEDDPYPGERGLVVAYAIRRRGSVLLFDTGFGFGNRQLEDRYQVVGRRVADVLAEAGVRLTDVDLVANCHLHADHAGQNATLPGIPIHARAGAGEYTIPEWIDGPGVEYIEADGDHELAPGIRILATPGHSPGHQSLVVDQRDGPVLLTGQAVYGLDEWRRTPGREGASSAPDRAAYDASLLRLRDLDPSRVLFAHDRRTWTR
jgi:glyoxylase-like metal-dependent hydrolase (beta-lactamase superfamily II)